VLRSWIRGTQNEVHGGPDVPLASFDSCLLPLWIPLCPSFFEIPVGLAVPVGWLGFGSVAVIRGRE
jgi:hypothetical protein